MSSASTYSPWCPKHRRALFRNGDIRQTTVTLPEVRPYIALLKQRHDADPSNPAWSILRKRWSALVDHATAALADAEKGRPFIKAHLRGASLVVGLAGNVDADTIIRTAMALHMLRGDDPRRLVSDRAEVFQVARLVLMLDHKNVGRSWNHATRSVRTVRRDFAPRSLEWVGLLLRAAFAHPAAVFHEAEKSRKTAVEDETRELVAGLKSLKAA